MKTKLEISAEKHFDMPFKDIVNELHMKREISLNTLSKQSGISRQSLTNIARRLNLEVRSVSAAAKLTKNRGDRHFMFGKTKQNCTLAKKHSDRMKSFNPIHCPKAQNKRALSISKTFIKNILPQEKIFKDILESYGIDFEMQKALGKYNLDFFIPSLSLAIEIDSTDKWGKSRAIKAAKRDADILDAFAIPTLRISRNLLGDKLSIYYILKANNIVL